MMQDTFPTPQNGNGAFSFLGGESVVGSLPPVARRVWTPQEIVKMVDQHEKDVQTLRDRMESDYTRYRLTEHVTKDVPTGEPLKDYAVYTSSEPRAFANKVISWLTQADLLLRVKHTNDKSHAKTSDNLKENYAIGLLRAADERLVRMLSPKLQASLAFHIAVRGGMVGGRCLLAKRPDGSTYVDITPWDPINTHYGVGADGLEWACYKVKKTRQQIQNEYGVTLPGATPTTDGSTDISQEGVDVYDFYDAATNQTIAKDEVIKPATPHGSPRVPVYMVLVGATPMVQTISTANTVSDMGESVFESARRLYDKWNDMMSVYLELTARARRQGLKVRSRDGKKTLPEDPYKEGTEISLAEGEDVEPLGMLEMAKDTVQFMNQLSGEIQRATIPHSAYGELPFQLSGYAINSLRQGIETVLTTRLEAMEQIYLQIANLLYDQYRTGFFGPMELSGMAQGRKYFSQTITVEQLQGACDYTVELVANLPQDDMTKFTMAQMARKGPTPLFSDNWIREEILAIQDAEDAASQVKEQMAEHALPEAGLYSLMKAAEEQGNRDLAAFYYQALVQLLGAKMGILPPGMAATPGAEGETAALKGASPTVRPQAALGTPPSPFTSNNATERVAPGTPRAPRPGG